MRLVAGRAGAAAGLGVAVAALVVLSGVGPLSTGGRDAGADVLPESRGAAPAVSTEALPPQAARSPAPVGARTGGRGTAPTTARALPPPEVRAVPGSPAPTTPVRVSRSSSRVVVGADGYLFIAQDWTVACQYAGRAQDAAAATADVVAALRDGGRPTTVVIGPNKSTVHAAEVPAHGVPQRACARRSAAEYWEALTGAAGPGAVDLRAALQEAARDEQPYWRLDTHWSPTGGTVLARALASRLDPLLAGRLTVRRATYERDGDLAETLGEPAREQLSALTTVNPGVTVVSDPPTDIGLRHALQRTRTEVGPAGSVVPGRTVFVGDSFTAIAVEQLAPLFEEAVFVWAVPEDPLPPVLRQLRTADRVVLQAVERRAWHRMIEPDVVPALQRLPPRTG